MKERVLIVIPARGGSRGIPGKNVRMMLGKPLISYAIACGKASKYNPTVIVTSEDEKIKVIARKFGAGTVDRPKELSGDNVTLDPVIFHAVNEMEKQNGNFDIVITMQPTTPTLTTGTLDNAIDYFCENGFDTVISGVNDPRLSWRNENGKYVPNYKARVNRQYMPEDIKETGAFVITKREFVKESGRFGNNISIFKMPEIEACDIDTPDDWCIAELKLRRKKVIIRVDGYKKIGMGHIYRGLQIADSLTDHDVLFVLDEKSDLGIEKITNSKYHFVTVKGVEEFENIVDEQKPDIIINDILNTDKDYINRFKKKARIVNFEDLGPGAEAADATINDLYEPSEGLKGDNIYWGSKYYIMRDEFLMASPSEYREKVSEILVIFGGTDPCNLTYKTIESLNSMPLDGIHVTVITGLGYSNQDALLSAIQSSSHNIEILQDVASVSEYMEKADLAISSQGRTMLELASVGVPTILMAQNPREKLHNFGNIRNGFLNLGLGSEVDILTLSNTIQWLIGCPQIRKNMHDEMLCNDLKHGMDRVRKIIFGE
jgi:CMP-N-acetylneuraminic acid synthetase